jgi:hypothetical protein
MDREARRPHGQGDRSLVSLEQIERIILELRGHRVLLDGDLAALYGVSTKRLNEQRKRNPGRFPADFSYQRTNSTV